MTMSSASDGFPAIARNASELPHAIRPTGWRLVWLIVQWGFGLVVGGVLALPLISGGDPNDLSPRMLVGLAGVLVVSISAAGLWRLRTPFVIFREDSVERRGLFAWRRLSRRDIEGVGKTVSNRNGAFFLIHPRPGAGGPISLPDYVRKDPVVARWLAGALDPQAEAVKADRAAILADPIYGATQAERASRLERARRAMVGLALAGACAGVWIGVSGPLSAVTTLLAVGVALVGAAVVVASKGLIVWFPGGKARPTAIGALGPLAGLMARAAWTVHLHHIGPPMIGGAVAGLGVAAILALSPRPALGGARAAIGVGVFAGLAAYAAAVLADVAFDRGRPATYATAIADKHVSHGRSTTYTLDLAAVGERPGESVSVGADAYDRAQIGDPICVVDHAGAIGLAWFEIQACPAGGAATAL